MTIKTILIANRGEIARRVIRTARTLGLKTVAVYSEADDGAPHMREADDAAPIGPASPAESYLNGPRIIEAARAAGADAIHPGYGFLSENADFAAAVGAAGLTFIGPPADAIRVMGDKAAAKRAMIEAGVPVAPGYQGAAQDDAALLEAADQVGFPLMVKAAAGGGGRGMRLAPSAGDLPAALAEARAEAEAAFGAGDLILERAIERPRHVEIQVFADAHGGVIHLGERDCSVQRRHQKVLEEAPSPAMTEELRGRMGAAAVAAARAVDYRGAGTVEFLLDEAGAFYFLEMNTRLQVEHPVTEAVTGLDLVALQIAVAEGAPLPLAQDEVHLAGHAIEARLYAEEPANGFLPSSGAVRLWRPSPLARVDDGIEEGGEASAHYDPLAAKLIAHGPTREAARARLIRALEDTALAGPATNRAFLIDALAHPEFVAGRATSAFIDEVWPDGVAPQPPPGEAVALAAALALRADRDAACAAAGLVGREQLGWRSDGPATALIDLTLGASGFRVEATPTLGGWRVAAGSTEEGDRPSSGEPVEVDLTEARDGRVTLNGRRRRAAWRADPGGDVALSLGRFDGVFTRTEPGVSTADAVGSGLVTAPMPGQLVELFAAVGDTVSSGDPVAVMEAMKMRHLVRAGVAGVLRELRAAPGDQLARGDVIAMIAT